MIDLFDLYLSEDCPYGDLTTDMLRIEGIGKISIISREHGVAACMDDLGGFYKKNGLEVVCLLQNGAKFNPDDVIFEAQGDLVTIFRLWRISQTFLSIVCSIAKSTRYALELARESNPDITIATSRKTHPGSRKYELKAVKAGGGDHHRNSLSDSILVTQNHLDVMDKDVVMNSMKKIEIEPRNKEEAYHFATIADMLLLDHYLPGELEWFVPELRALNPYLKIAVGGIDLSMISEYARHVDIIVTTAPYYSRPLDLTSDIKRL